MNPVPPSKMPVIENLDSSWHWFLTMIRAPFTYLSELYADYYRVVPSGTFREEYREHGFDPTNSAEQSLYNEILYKTCNFRY